MGRKQISAALASLTDESLRAHGDEEQQVPAMKYDDHRLRASDRLVAPLPALSLDWVSFHSEVVDMSGAASVDDAGSLSGWLRVTLSHQRARRRWAPAVTGATWFAFYGRISTGEYQDATSSRTWQLDSARQAIAGRGHILEEFFYVGCSRRLPWTERPKAAALLTAATSTDHPFNAVVVGEYERALPRQPTRSDHHRAGLLRRPAVVARNERTGRPGKSGAPGADDAARSPVQPGDPASPVPHHDGDDRTSP